MATLKGTFSGADERRTDVVAAEAAVTKGHCPRYGRARDGAHVGIQCTPLLGTDRHALQLVVVQRKIPVSRRNRELDNVCMLVCMIVSGMRANQS